MTPAQEKTAFLGALAGLVRGLVPRVAGLMSSPGGTAIRAVSAAASRPKQPAAMTPTPSTAPTTQAPPPPAAPGLTA